MSRCIARAALAARHRVSEPLRGWLIRTAMRPAAQAAAGPQRGGRPPLWIPHRPCRSALRASLAPHGTGGERPTALARRRRLTSRSEVKRSGRSHLGRSRWQRQRATPSNTDARRPRRCQASLRRPLKGEFKGSARRARRAARLRHASEDKRCSCYATPFARMFQIDRQQRGLAADSRSTLLVLSVMGQG